MGIDQEQTERCRRRSGMGGLDSRRTGYQEDWIEKDQARQSRYRQEKER